MYETLQKFYMKYFFIFFSLFAITNICFAQQNPKFSIEAFAGPSFPLGKFANKNYMQFNNSAELAKTGITAGSNLKYKLNNNFSVALNFAYSSNKQDKQAINNYLNKGANYPLDTKIETSSWQIAKVLAGFYYKHPINNSRFSFNAGIVAGVSKTSIPHYSWVIYSQPGIVYNSAEQDKKSLPWAFSYQISAGINYEVKKNMYCLLSANYFNANTTYNPSNLKYAFNSATLVVGVGFRF
jgi:opacity protein-like surface antigen